MDLLYKKGFGLMGVVRLKIGTIFIAILKAQTPPTMDETWERGTKENKKKKKTIYKGGTFATIIFLFPFDRLVCSSVDITLPLTYYPCVNDL